LRNPPRFVGHQSLDRASRDCADSWNRIVPQQSHGRERVTYEAPGDHLGDDLPHAPRFVTEFAVS
jgi:hypothetical protein